MEVGHSESPCNITLQNHPGGRWKSSCKTVMELFASLEKAKFEPAAQLPADVEHVAIYYSGNANLK
ncbi:hypothetical protein [Bradyrhizobium sp.]|uniref:hypothetical protein n=1 Tax=Bradyrhizobium sp. TaxID=376 RepID=UPI002C20FAA9|nr:hypothetical protein [Bradyrhizobium sp.]HMM91731.1 hypothetical protein [Bradyrhizobium sp.]